MADNSDSSETNSTKTHTVNAQIIDAVDTSNDYVFGLTQKLYKNENTNRLSTGAAIAFDKAAQAASLSVQDASDYVRNVMAISAAAQGKAMAELLSEQNTENAPTVITSAQAAVTAAIKNFSDLSSGITTLLSAFPRG